jgi:hypothetical protein
MREQVVWDRGKRRTLASQTKSAGESDLSPLGVPLAFGLIALVVSSFSLSAVWHRFVLHSSKRKTSRSVTRFILNLLETHIRCTLLGAEN